MSLAQRLREQGLYLRGVARLLPAEIEAYGFPAQRPLLALVGNIGSSYWSGFSRSPEFNDGDPDPLDRWSRRIAMSLADEFPVQPIYPFAGPPYYPFQQWAQRAEGLSQSPLGIMMHPQHGLWHSYRFALLGEHFEVSASPDPVVSPCVACVNQPCLQACPVGAFDGDGYDVDRCAGYLRQTPDADCHVRGCIARLACPVAPELRYVPEQGEFHLRAFLGSA